VLRVRDRQSAFHVARDINLSAFRFDIWLSRL
jgi:hypothetical protein